MARTALMTVTDTAVERIKTLLSKAPEATMGIRLSVQTKGCSGLSYKVDYASEPKAGDERIDTKGVTVFVDPGAVLFLIGTEMDYVEGELKSGFEFRNPNESGRCGCGESFYVDKDALTSADSQPKA